MSQRFAQTLFEVTRRDSDGNISGKYAAAALRGIALGAHATDEESFALAQHNTFVGHLTRDVAVGGISVSDRMHKLGVGFVPSDDGVVWEPPFKAGQEVSVAKAREIELEGVEYLWTSGTGALNGSETPGQNLSFFNGRLRKTQASEIVNYSLAAILVPLNTASATNFRFRCEAR